ncbi:uncharacterized protein LOC135378883 isoform X1 [Ornithodoros turicata]|uniref:uncharacterized protein LOC135378883 isoform X1 n=2 Tax=Ornithodoros turicata TaxID=34597 RepID=UPI0031395ADD
MTRVILLSFLLPRAWANTGDGAHLTITIHVDTIVNVVVASVASIIILGFLLLCYSRKRTVVGSTKASLSKTDEPPTLQNEPNVHEENEWEDTLRVMHKAIDERSHIQVQQCLRMLRHLRLWLHPDTGESAMHRAIKSNSFYIYGLLLSHECDFRSEKEWKCLRSLNRIQRSELQRQRLFVTKYDDSYVNHLKARTESQTNSQGFGKYVDKMFKALDNIELVRPILQVAATAHHLRIRFDFDRGDVQPMMGCRNSGNLGITDTAKDEVFIAANPKVSFDADRDAEVLGTLAHELCHFALHLVFRNGGIPYCCTDLERKRRYDDIIQGIRKKQEGLDKIIKLALDYATEEELIVRVPHVLALRGSPGKGDAILRGQTPELLEFYNELVTSDMANYIKNACPSKDTENIKIENVRLQKADNTEKLNVTFTEPMKHQDLKDVPLLILTGPELLLLEILVHDALKSTGQPYLFFEASQWDDTLADVLTQNKCNFILLTCNDSRKLRTIFELLSEVSQVVGTRVILLVPRGHKDYFLAEEQQDAFFANSSFFRVHMNRSFAYIDKACFEKIAEKRKVLSKSHILFQGADYRPLIHDVISLDNFVNFIDAPAFLKLCQSKYIEVGPQLSKVAQDVNDYYVRRRLTFGVRGEDYSEEYLWETQEKVVAVCGLPGTGKSALASRLSIQIKNIDVKNWVLHVYLPRRIGLVNLANGVRDFQQLAHLCNVEAIGPEFKLFEHCVQNDTPVKIVIIFDAFDEIKTECREYILALVKLLKKTNVSKICIMSRTVFKTTIGDAIEAEPMEMVPFTKEELVEFFRKYWRAHGLCSESDDELELTARKTANAYTLSMWNGWTAWENPLLIRMIAELEHRSLFCREPVQSIEPTREIRSMFEIYKMFADYKYNVYTKEKLLMESDPPTLAAEYESRKRKEEFYGKLGLLGASVIIEDQLREVLTEEELEELKSKGDLMKDVADSVIGHGLVDGLSDGIPGFIHKTFAEYFAAHFLFRKIKNVGSDNPSLMASVSRMYGKDDYRQVMLFLDSFAAESLPVHFAIVTAGASAGSCITEENMYTRDEFDRIPLHYIAIRAHSSMLKVYFVDALLKPKDIFGMTPFMYADSLRHWHLLNKFCDRNMGTSEECPTIRENVMKEKELKKSALYEAVRLNLCALLDFILSNFCRKRTDSQLGINLHLVDVDTIRDEHEQTLLFFAESLNALQLLLAYCDSRVTDADGHITLSYRLEGNLYRELLHERKMSRLAILKFLCIHLHVDIPNNRGETPLRKIVSARKAEYAKVLLLRSRTNRADRRGVAVLRCAYGTNQPDIINLLLPHASIYDPGVMSYLPTQGADLDRTLLKWTLGPASSLAVSLYYYPEKLCQMVSKAISEARSFQALLPYLNYSHGGNPVASLLRWNPHRRLVVLKHLLFLFDASSTDEEGFTALHRSAKVGSVDEMKLLLPHSNIHAEDGEGRTAAQVHCGNDLNRENAAELIRRWTANEGS